MTIDVDHLPDQSKGEAAFLEDYKRCLADKMWRLHNLYWIKDKNGKRVKFRPNKAQLKYLEDRHSRNSILKARQLGFTTLIQIDMLDDCLFKSNTNAGVIAHSREDAQAFFKDKIKFAYDNLAPHLKQQIPAKNDAANELRFSNGSVIRVGTSLRSGTNQRLHISEYGKICAKYPDKAEEVKTGALPTVPPDGLIEIESTAEGRSGHFFDLCDTGLKREQEDIEPTPLEYKLHFYPWYDEPTYKAAPLDVLSVEDREYFKRLKQEHGVTLTPEQKSWYVQEKRTYGDKMGREYPSTPEEAFEASIEGAYFARQMAQIRAKGQITKVPIVPDVPVQTFWDLGRDTTAIWFFQEVGFEYRFVNYYENSGEGMNFYIRQLKDLRDGTEPYLWGDAWLPHDGDRRSIASNESPAHQLYSAGWQVRIVSRIPDKALAIERARLALPLCYFDKDMCAKGITHLDSYRKEWDEAHGVWKKQPLHNEASHGADAFMVFADGYYHEQVIENEVPPGQVTGKQGRSRVTGY